MDSNASGVSEFWVIVTAIGVIATAVVTAIFGFLNLRNTTLYNLPKPIATTRRFPGDGASWMELKVRSMGDGPEWEIRSVSVRGLLRRRFLARAKPIGSDPFGQIEGYEADGKWHRSIKLVEYSNSCVVVIHSDAPDFSLSVNISLSSAPSKRSSVVTRYKAAE